MRAAAGEGPRPDLALAAFTRAIEVAADDGPTLDSARDGLVHAFAAAGRPVRAAALFTRLAALPRPVERRDVALLERLALAYFARGQPRESAVIDRELLRRHPADPEACTWQTRLLLTAVATRDLAAQRREAQRLAALWQRWQSDPRHPDEIQRKCRDAARDALIDLTRAWRPADPARVARRPSPPVPRRPARVRRRPVIRGVAAAAPTLRPRAARDPFALSLRRRRRSARGRPVIRAVAAAAPTRRSRAAHASDALVPAASRSPTRRS